MNKLSRQAIEQRLKEIEETGGVADPKPPKKIRESAVLIPLIWKNDRYEVLFEKRALTLAMQPGDICLPGGGIEAGETGKQAAIREVTEELLIREDQVHVLGALDGVLGPGEQTIWPFVGVIEGYQDTWSEDEVDHTFTVPLTHFLVTEPERYEAQQVVVPSDDFPYEKVSGKKKYQFKRRKYDFMFYSYNGYHIWGATARIMYYFAAFWNEEKE